MPEKEVLFWEGYCTVHHRLTAQDVRGLKEAHPGAVVAAHPECPPEVLELADFIGSTTGIIGRITQGTEPEFIVLTEEGVGHQLKHCGKTLHFPAEMICEDMKKNTLADLRRALETVSPEVKVQGETRRRALAPIEKMLAK